MFKKAVLVVALAVTMIPSNAFAIDSLVVNNDSSTCAWITIYVALNQFHTWSILKNHEGRPRFVKPGAKVRLYGTAGNGEVKARAEFMKNADCSGNVIEDHDVVTKDALRDRSLAANLSGKPGSFRIKWGSAS